ncbi:hypothetical protein CROQUDRAFT_40486 [Cronartium quercuum f. sp. fusiforme G11]|uniref:Wax synthase domain-containing protein n=1 Tax=Cronartium quercuum f. sp. fusiforme G11 TaxID=708437 RepID=A0A9P6TFQ4_9BASI|nr:hypothetical protein CROQUDRAFT_40486 [Cronartium quercuum f. sp. fusiforme G11]
MDTLKTFIKNDSVFTTFLDPRNALTCHPPSLSILLLLFPLFVQCSLLHPQLATSRTSRYIRLVLVPLNVYCAMKIGVDYCFTPLERRGLWNLMLGCMALHLAMKGLEWGLLGRSEMIKYRTRPEFREKDVDQAGKNHESSKATISFTESDSEKLSLKELYVWTAEQFASPRGIQYGWGYKSPPNTRSASDVFKRLMKVHLVHLAAVAYSVHTRDSGSAVEALRTLGLAGFPGNTIVAEALSSLAFGMYLISLTDLAYSYYTLFGHFIINMAPFLPDWYRVYFNPKLYVPLYDNPHLATSLAQLWSTGWHQLFRRNFVVCGALPARKIVRMLGLGNNAQKIASVIGCFIVSGVMHELAIHFIARAPHPDPHFLFDTKRFPGSLFYFLMQPIGILLEPMVLKYVPMPWMWVYAFTLLCATPFRYQYFGQNRLLDKAYPPISEWNLISVLVPGGIVRF